MISVATGLITTHVFTAVYGLTHLPNAAYMHQWTGPSLVKVMACRLFGTTPLPEPMLAYCQLDTWEQISVKFESELYHFHSRKCIWKCRLPKWQPFCPGGDELMHRGLKIMAAILLMAFSHVLHWKRMFVFWFKSLVRECPINSLSPFFFIFNERLHK